MHHQQYRSDIDGLRAVAVLAVLGFHVFPERIPSGFIGVDIFFVISGFLISSIILKSLENKSFSYLEFYARRINRIFPALILVMIISLAFGWFVLMSDEYQQLAKHIVGGTGFISNFVLWEEAGYFDSEADQKPLLHLWSLAIEEQFYIFWPLLLGLFWRKQFHFLAVMIIVAVVSFGFNLHYAFQHSVAAYYSPLGRFWELMVGGLLAWITLYKPHYLSYNTNLLSIIGLVLLVMGFLLVNQRIEFPGWWALLPTLGAFFIIAAGKNAFLNKYFLGQPILVGIGLISYPLYLWHWPLIAYAHVFGNEIGFSFYLKIALLISSFVLAYLTYILLEQKLKALSNKRVFFLFASNFTLLIFGVIVYQYNFQPRNHQQGIESIINAAGEVVDSNDLASIKYGDYTFRVKYGASDKVVFYGDSHMEQYIPRVVKLLDDAKNTRKTAVFVTKPGCLPIPNLYSELALDFWQCVKFREEVFNYLLSDDVSTIVVGACWNCYFIFALDQKNLYYLNNDNKVFFQEPQGIDLALSSLTNLLVSLKAHKKVYLLLDNPGGQQYNPKNYWTGSRLGEIKVNFPASKFNLDQKQNEIRLRLLEVANKVGVKVIDPTQQLCKNGECLFLVENNIPIYKDDNHLRYSYIKSNISYLDEVLTIP